MGARRRLFAALAALAAVALSACGSEDFANDPRPAAPVALTARIGNNGVAISPGEIGGGVAAITISNQTADPAQLVIEGPSDRSSAEVVPGGTGSMKVNLAEGDYAVSDGESDTTTELVVGPKRPSSQNDLLLP